MLVVASTLPARNSDPVPAFVKDQIIALAKLYSSELIFDILAPHNAYSKTKNLLSHRYYTEYRFHYFLPALEKLTGRSIIPTLKSNPLYYLLIPFLFIGEFIALYRLTKKNRPALIYAHWFTPQAVTSCIVGRLTNTPFVFTTHASDVSVWSKIPFFGTLVVRRATERARAITAVSQRSLKKLSGFFKPEQWQKISEKTKIIPMGVTLPASPNLIKRKSSVHRVLFIGRLAEKKGVHFLLPAFAKFATKHPDTHLLIAGDGPELNALKTLASSLNISEKVNFLGFISGREKKQLLSDSDTLVVPSIITKSGDAEGLPVALMEGLAYGKVCIASNESGADDVLTHKKDGYLVSQKNIAQLTSALEWAYNLSSSKRIAISKSALITAEQFSWPKIAKEYYKFLLK